MATRTELNKIIRNHKLDTVIVVLLSGKVVLANNNTEGAKKTVKRADVFACLKELQENGAIFTDAKAKKTFKTASGFKKHLETRKIK